MLDEPLGNQPELSLAGLGLEPQAEVINLTGNPSATPPRRSLRRKDAPIPDLFGDADQPRSPARVHCWMKRPVSPCGQGSAPTASTNELAIDDIVSSAYRWLRLSTGHRKDIALPDPREDTLPRPSTQETGEAAAQEQPGQAFLKHRNRNRPPSHKGRTEGPSRMLSRRARHLTKPSVPCTELDEALGAPSGAINRATQMVCQPPPNRTSGRNLRSACWTIRPAALKEVACSGNMDEIVQLMPDLVSAINRNRASFEEAERDG